MSDLFGNHIVGFPTRRLICISEGPRHRKHQVSIITVDLLLCVCMETLGCSVCGSTLIVAENKEMALNYHHSMLN